MHCKLKRSSKPAARRGILTIELILTLPILIMLLLAMLEFTLLFLARGEVAEASRLGARRAMLANVSEEDVQHEVERVLPARLRQGAQVRIELGDRSGDVVAVGVSVPMHAASPDLMWPIGFSVKNRDMYCETRMVKE